MDVGHTAQAVFFGLIAAVMCAAAVRVVTSRNIIHAALALVIVLAGVAGQFLLLVAEFAALTQVLVYIGAIVVLFLFGIMLTKAPLGDSLDKVEPRQAAIAGTVAVGLFGLMAYALTDTWGGDDVVAETAQALDLDVIEVVEIDSDAAEEARVSTQADVIPFDDFDPLAFIVPENAAGDPGLSNNQRIQAQLDKAMEEAGFVPGTEGLAVVIAFSNTQSVADTIFSQYIVAFEAISLLLLAALIGAVVLARKD